MPQREEQKKVVSGKQPWHLAGFATREEWRADKRKKAEKGPAPKPFVKNKPKTSHPWINAGFGSREAWRKHKREKVASAEQELSTIAPPRKHAEPTVSPKVVDPPKPDSFKEWEEGAGIKEPFVEEKREGSNIVMF